MIYTTLNTNIAIAWTFMVPLIYNYIEMFFKYNTLKDRQFIV